MVTIYTRLFGEIEVEDEKIITFPEGVYAFEDTRHYALISPLGDDVYPMWLQCVDAADPCFVVFDPSKIDPSYSVALGSEERKLLKADENTEMLALVFATVPENFRNTTVNMKSPVLINTQANIGAQVILSDNYPFKLPIYVKAEDDS
jgi:flagellar assembly factor FliW